MKKLLVVLIALFWMVLIGTDSFSYIDSGVAEIQQETFSHGAALFRAKLKYPKNFTHFDWVNPNAPKGGKIEVTGAIQFTSFTPWLPGGIGINPPGIGLIKASLMTSSRDITEEPFSMYAGPVAIGVRYPEDISWVEFQINPDARFHDGTLITPEDVIWSMEVQKANNPNIASYYREVGEGLKMSEHIVRFEFMSEEPNSELPLIVGQLTVYSKKDWENHDPNRIRKKPFLGCGPYKITKFKMGEYIEYQRVEKWWGENLPTCKGRYNFDTIRYTIYLDRTVAFEAFKAGKAHIFFENTAARWATSYEGKLFKSGKVVKKAFPHHLPYWAQGFYFNFRSPLFRGSGRKSGDSFPDEGDEEGRLIRRAIELAFPFPEISRSLLYEQYIRSSSFFGKCPGEAKGMPEGKVLKILEKYRGRIPEIIFTNPEELEPPSGRTRRNLKEAEKILDSLGWKINRDELREKNGQVFEFQILLRESGFERHASYFVDHLKKLGIKAEYKTVDSSTYFSLWSKREPGSMDMFVGSPYGGINPGNEKIAQWGSKEADINSSNNVCGLKHGVIDELANAIKSVSSREELNDLAKALDYVLKALKPCVFHWHLNSDRVAYENIFSIPSTIPDTGVEPVTSWWIEEKE